MPYLVEPVVDPGVVPALQPELGCGDLTLRPWSTEDARQLVAVFADRHIQRWHLRSLTDEQEAQDLVATWRDGWRQRASASWAVVLSADPGTVVGQVGLRAMYLDDGMAEVSYWVAPDWRRLGIATRATDRLVGWAFDGLGLERLELVHSTRNKPSCGVARDAGFRFEGTKVHLQRHQDGWHNMHLHARVRTAATKAAETKASARPVVTGYAVAAVAALVG